MTSPDGEIPEESLTPTEIYELQYADQESLAAQSNLDMRAAAELVRTNFFNGILGGILSVPLGIAKAIGDFIASLVYALKGVTGGLVDLTGFLGETRDKADQAQDTATGAIEQVNVIEQQVGDKLSYFDVRSNVPMWQSIHPVGFQSIPRSQLTMKASKTDSQTNRDTGSHSHDIVSWLIDPEMQVPSGRAVGAGIRCEGNMAIGLVQFYARGVATDLRVRLYRMATNGSATPLTPVSSNLAGLLLNVRHTEIQWLVGENAVVEAGDIVVAFVWANASTVYLAGVDIFDPLPAPGFYPQKIGMNASWTSINNGSTLSAPNITYQGLTPFFSIEPELGQALEKRQVYDNFNRPDTVYFPNYNYSTTISGGVAVVSKQLVWRKTGQHKAILTFLQPLSTDKIDGQFVIGSFAGTDPAAITRVIVMGTGSAQRGLSIGAVPGNGYRVEYATAVDTYTPITSFPDPPQPYDVIQFFINGTNVQIFRNGVLKLNITVTAAQVPRGPGNRYVSVSLRRASGFDWDNHNSPSLDSYFAQDTPDAVEEE